MRSPACACPAAFSLSRYSRGFRTPPRGRSKSACRSLCSGLALRAWAAGCLAKNQQLATGGPYAYTRNPLYLGTLLVAAGLSIAARSPGLGALFAAVFVCVSAGDPERIGVLARSIRDYAAYAAAVPLLLPRLTPRRSEKSESFSFRAVSKEPGIQCRCRICRRDAVLLWKLVR